MNLTFRDLVNCTEGYTAYTGDNFLLEDVKFDSRGNMKGSAFIAFVTERDNGHKYISIAINKGALTAIVSEDTDIPVPTIKVRDTQKAYQDIAAFYRKKFKIPIIALTGSNGKTTVKDMLSTILSVKYKVLATEKNLNNEIGVPQTLLKLNETHDVAVIEMGMNHTGEIRTLANITKPDIAIITKIGTAHMGNLNGTRKSVFDAKMEIINGLKNNGLLVLNSDDDMLMSINSKNFDVVFCGLNDKESNFIRAFDVKQFWNETGYSLSFQIAYNSRNYTCTLPVIGKHNTQNALLALTVGIKLGININEAISALRNYPRSSMRLDISVICGIRFIKDYYNASPESTKSALDTFAELGVTGSRIFIFGDLSELGEQSENIHYEIAKYTIGKADKVYYIGDYCESFKKGRSDVKCFASKDDLNKVIFSDFLNGAISTDDVVLIKGGKETKMWEQYEYMSRVLENGNTLTAQTQLQVDVDALKYNYSTIKNYVGQGVKVVPVIKADAYGTGARLLANIYNDCDYFAIADLIEAEKLHSIMLGAKFLVLYQPLINEVGWIVERDYVVPSVCTIDFIKKLNHAASKKNKKIPVQIEVDTGMGRLGVLQKNCKTFATELLECKNLTVEGIFTHYSSADIYKEDELNHTYRQTENFKEAIKIIENIIGFIPYKHACASAAIFNPMAEIFNMVRPGYILRGYYPCEEIRKKIDLRPALKYVTRVTLVEEHDEGSSISYGRTYTTGKKNLIAKVPVGYDDGLMRKLSNKGAFVINGQLAPIVGNITMDYTMIDVTNISPVVCVGDEVAVFDNVNMTIEKMAELCGTIGYEIITNIKNKADRVECF